MAGPIGVTGPVYAGTEKEARGELAQFVAEVRGSDGTTRADARRVTLDVAVCRFLYEHLLDERGREPKTVDDYWKLHHLWFSAGLSRKFVRNLTRPRFDARFGAMRARGAEAVADEPGAQPLLAVFRWASTRA